MFYATNKCDSDSKKWCFLLKWMVTKKTCDTNKNEPRMDVIIKGVYCTKQEFKLASSCKTQLLFTQVKFPQMNFFN